MWIELTDCYGQPVTLNSRHIVALRTCGEATLISHLGGETLVVESYAQIKLALQLQPINRPRQTDAEHANLH